MTTTQTPAARREGELSREQLEGMMLGQRRLVEALLALCLRDRQDAAAVLDRLSDDLGLQDHQEDPGVDPDPAFAVERHADLEVRRILSRVEAMLRVEGDRPVHGPSPSAVA